MPLSAGDKLGPYEILAPIGAGGMGEVYKARDPRLKRDVSIKVSGAQFSERFEREAHAIAALNHPNICQIYDVGPNYLVMEFIEGQPIRVPESTRQLVDLATQIADGLAAAHAAGITHRDLKPDNILVSGPRSANPGRVKILDFGLAKRVGAAKEPSATQTILGGTTDPGTVLGTVAYMSPEQARGEEADGRSDQFSLGLVLYELAAGKRAFSRESAAETMTAIIRDDAPPLPSSVPAPLRWVIERCLAKDRAERYDSTRDLYRELKQAREHLSEASVSGSQAPTPSKATSTRPGWVVSMAVASLFAAGLAWTHFREVAPPSKLVRFQIPAPSKAPIIAFRLSPDGKHLVIASGQKLWLRSLDSVETKEIPGTEGGNFPFWSPDSEQIGFFAQNKLKRIPRTGGTVQTLADAGGGGRRGSWNREGTIVFSPGPNDPIHRVPAAGGAAVPVTRPSGDRRFTGHRFPEFLPDGSHFFYLATAEKDAETGVWLGSLREGNGALVLEEASIAIYTPGRQRHGFVFFRRAQTLVARPFDANGLKFEGDAAPVIEAVGTGTNTGFGAFSLATDGTLVFRSSLIPKEQLLWVDRAGNRLEVLSPSIDADESSLAPTLSLAPDGRRVAYGSGSVEQGAIWVQGEAGTPPSRLTFTDTQNTSPVWAPDGRSILFSSRTPNVRSYATSTFLKSADGSQKEELFLTPAANRFAYDLSSDSKWLAYMDVAPSRDIWLAPLEGKRTGTPVPVANSPADEGFARFSPDGKFLAYQSNESGRNEVYVQPAPPNGSKWLVSKEGGTYPRWKGSEIYFIGTNGKLMAVPVRTSPTFSSGSPQPLFDAPNRYDVAGPNRFLVAIPLAEGPPPLNVLTDWQAGR